MKGIFVMFSVMLTACSIMLAEIQQNPNSYIEQPHEECIVDDYCDFPVEINGSPWIENIGRESENLPARYAPLWADDILVTNECPIVPANTKLAFDYDIDGNIYVSILADHGSDDTIWTYKSTDRGYTWHRGWDLWFYPSDVNVMSYDMRVQAQASNPYLYQVAVFEHAGDTYCEFRRIMADSSANNWYTFDYDNICWVEMDITDEASPHIYVLYTTGTTSWSLRRRASADGGVSWTSGTVSTTYGSYNNYDLCAAGGDGAYVIFYSNANAIRRGRYQSYFTSSAGFIDVVTESDFSYPVAVSSRYNSYPSNYLHIVYLQSSAQRAAELVSSDGGQTFTGPSFFLIGDNIASRPFVACTRYGTDDAFIGLVTRYETDQESLMVGYKSNQSASWTNIGFENQYRSTGEVRPQGNYVNSGPLPQGLSFVYREYGMNNVYYDRASRENSVEEPISQVGSDFNTRISFISGRNILFVNSSGQQTAEIKIYDLSGRPVRTVFNGILNQGENSFDLSDNYIPSGAYFINIKSGTISETAKFIISN